ncbi:YdcH family protein [Oryzifoliimicrobium ureilyticus]|uniref:YdcH family protein n=1 Tax=Oryzifoliimicrobium ureilyticus TaxID=3113724 RepID=UPI00307680B5
MTVQAHLESLEKKHVALEEELHAMMASPSVRDNEIAECKRRKLRIKDEIERLRTSIH